MSVSLGVYGVVPADEEFNKMKSIHDSCEEMGITPPKEVVDFFDGERPDPAGMVIWMDDSRTDGVTEWGNDYSSGYEIEIAKLDPKIKIIRCTLS